MTLPRHLNAMLKSTACQLDLHLQHFLGLGFFFFLFFRFVPHEKTSIRADRMSFG